MTCIFYASFYTSYIQKWFWGLLIFLNHYKGFTQARKSNLTIPTLVVYYHNITTQHNTHNKTHPFYIIILLQPNTTQHILSILSYYNTTHKIQHKELLKVIKVLF